MLSDSRENFVQNSNIVKLDQQNLKKAKFWCLLYFKVANSTTFVLFSIAYVEKFCWLFNQTSDYMYRLKLYLELVNMENLHL